MDAVLEAVRRDLRGKNEAGRLRRQGRIPATLYGESKDAEALAVDPKALLQILHAHSGVNTLISLKVAGGDETRVLLKEYQLHPMSHHLLHADFYRVAMDKLLRVAVPVHLTGEAKGVKADGGIVDFVHREVLLECLPADIPGHITVDITELALHDAVRVRDLAPDPKWKAVSEPDMLIVHIMPPKVEEVAAPAEGAVVAGAAPVAPAEPEVIKKGKIEKPEDEKE
jgi:large subunit ribosomal protein L25